MTRWPMTKEFYDPAEGYSTRDLIKHSLGKLPLQMEDAEPLPSEFADRPELELVWRGLSISINGGSMTRQQAYEMLKTWEKEKPPDGGNST